jgi:hypothetical protein
MRYIPASHGRQMMSRQARVLHVRGIGYVTRIDDYQMRDGSLNRVRTTGAVRMGTRDMQVTRYRTQGR